MKFIKIFLILLLISSCSNQKKITEFENILGYEESKTLTYLVEDFENNYLKKIYPNLKINKAYHSFLTDLEKNGGIPNPENISKENYEKYKNSKLRLQIYGKPDSIWIEKGKIPTLKIKWKFLTKNEKFEFSLSESSPITLSNDNSDSIITRAKNRTEINHYGSYNEALKTTAEELKFIKEYIEHRDTFGDTNPSIFVNRLLTLKPNFTNYFIKRIIVLELIYG